jgi:hypothetical protein
MRMRPDIGEWYRILDGDEFEVVAIDEDDGTIEVQYFDGTVEELESSDWEFQFSNGDIEKVDAPEDGKGSADFDDDDEAIALSSHLDSRVHIAGGLDGLDLFESPDSFH